jgi:tRNA pseudouridine55 synthase
MDHGILLIDKPRGMTSHDVVAAVRRFTGIRQIGHTGTLDPEASGVLVLCLGRSTRLACFFEALEKTYWAVMRLGIRTDTQDATGHVVSQAPVPPFSCHDITMVLQQFTGSLQQIPPMYSAVKYHGRRLYHLARQGHTVTRQARSISVRRCELLDMRGTWLTLAIACSKGTYVRTLCDDIGVALGCGGHVLHIQRCQVGPFSLRQAYTLAFLQQRMQEGALAQLLLPIGEALHFLPNLTLTTLQYEGLQRGQSKERATILQSLSGSLPPASGYRLSAPGHGPFAVMRRQTIPVEHWKLYSLQAHTAKVEWPSPSSL